MLFDYIVFIYKLTYQVAGLAHIITLKCHGNSRLVGSTFVKKMCGEPATMLESTNMTFLVNNNGYLLCLLQQGNDYDHK